MDIAVVGAGVNLVLDAPGCCTEAHVALGAVAPTQRCWSPTPARRWSAHTLDEAALEKLDAAASAACKPISDKRGTIDYRTKIAGVLARRAAAIAYARARAERHRTDMSKHDTSSTTVNGEPVEFLCEAAADPAGRAARRTAA